MIKNTLPDLIPGRDYLPASKKLITREDMLTVMDSVMDMNFTEGRYNSYFQELLAKVCNRKYAVTCNSGSSANWLAITSLRKVYSYIKDGDEIITVACAFPTTVNPILQNNLVPVFVDMDYESLNIDVDLIESAITNKTRAIMIAHTLGNPVDIRVIESICAKYNLHLIFDCCDSLGGFYDGKPIGSFGEMATFSFYPAHQITAGEAGAVVTNDPKLNLMLNSLKSWGKNCFCQTGEDNACGHRFDKQYGDLPLGYDHKYVYSEIGMNLKITDMQAALGFSQLKKLEDFKVARQSNYNVLAEKMKELDLFFVQTKTLEKSDPSWFGYPLIFRSDNNATNKLINYLEKYCRIGTRRLFAGNLLRHPAYKKLPQDAYRVVGELKNTDRIMNNVFWVGVHPSLNKDCMDYIFTSIYNFYILGYNGRE
jgi:CDP-6-deoxy-D-xylo-4-hexulose-3-dehydrase